VQHRELLRRQRDLHRAPAAAQPGRVDDQVAHGDRHGPFGAAAPHQGAQPGQQHHVRERLGQVVVGAVVQGLGLVVDAVLGGEHHDRRPVAGLAQPGAERVAVHPGQHHVQDDHVVVVLRGQPEPVAPVVGHVDGEALAGQPAFDQVGQPPLVLHQ
jgi:hypothetical protein